MAGPVGGCEPVTTNGVIAMLNLQGQIDSLASRAAAGQLTIGQRVELIDLLSLRGQILGRIADTERAAALAEQLVGDAPANGLAFLTRARMRAAFHCFAEALADLSAAEQLGSERAALEAEGAAIFQALGRYEAAFILRQNAVERRPDFATLGALAVLQAERGQTAEAEGLFCQARRRYQGISPFPVALLDFQRGLMWLEQGNRHTARAWFDAAQCRLPAYAAALGHLAEVEAALGEREAAINRLRPLALASDDPEYAGLLAGLLNQVGQSQEAGCWCTQAAARYDDLLTCHPAAFADHAAEFWLTAGADEKKARQLAWQNLVNRQTPRAYALLNQAIRANVNN